MEKQTSANPMLRQVAWVVLALAMALSVFVRCRLADFPLERDEGEYAYAGRLILQGVPPYGLAYNMKLPGTYLAYAGLMAVFGQTIAGIHYGLLAVGLATILLIFLLMRDLFDSMSGAVAALAFSILSTSPTSLGMAAHATHFVALFGVAGAWILWRATLSGKIAHFFAAGILLGIAFLMKQQGVFLPCFGGLATLVFCIRRPPVFRWRPLATCVGYAAGVVLPYALTCLWLWRAGTFDKFWSWTVDYARTYVGQLSSSQAVEAFWTNTQGVIGANWPLWLLAAVGTVALARMGGIAGRRAFVFAFCGFSFLCVCPGFYFRQHYYIVFLPGVAMLTGIGAVGLARGAGWLSQTALFSPPAAPAPAPRRHRNRRETRPAAPAPNAPDAVNRGFLVGLTVVVIVVAMALPLAIQQDFYFVWSPATACGTIYGPNPFVEAPEIGRYIKDHSGPKDFVAVVGSEPEIFFYADRISATGYIYTYPLMEVHPSAHQMQEEMIREIESAKPKFLVFVSLGLWTSWLPKPDSDPSILKWVQPYLEAWYRPVGLCDALSSTRPNCKWGPEAFVAKPQSQWLLWVFERKSGAAP